MGIGNEVGLADGRDPVTGHRQAWDGFWNLNPYPTRGSLGHTRTRTRSGTGLKFVPVPEYPKKYPEILKFKNFEILKFSFDNFLSFELAILFYLTKTDSRTSRINSKTPFMDLKT